MVLTFQSIGQSDTTNPNLLDIAIEGSSIEWLYFKNPVSSSAISPMDFLASIKVNLGLGDDDSFVLSKTITDDSGNKQHRFDQFYKGIKVESCNYILHEFEGNYTHANGKIGLGINKSVSVSISKDSARTIALNSINSNVWGWEVYEIDTVYLDSTSSNYTLDTLETHASYPNGELVIEHIQNNNVYSDSNFRLSYSFEISSHSPIDIFNKVYVDAVTGSINSSYDLRMHSGGNCHTGTVNTIYYGTQNITTKRARIWPAPAQYKLIDECRGAKITTKKRAHLGNWIVSDPNNTFVNNWGDRSAASVHWGLEMAYDYYLQEHNRNSFNGNGRRIIGIWENGSGGSSYQFRGTVNRSDKITIVGNETKLDIIGHEFAHGVTHYASGLSHLGGESVALHESYSDIFGVMINYKKHPTSFDYQIDADKIGGGNNLY